MMKKSTLFLFAVITMLMIGGCSKKTPVPATPSAAAQSDESSANLESGGVSTGTTKEVIGGVNSEGKYTGSDGVSKSGIKMLYFASDKYVLDNGQVQRLMSDLPKIKLLTARGKIRIEGNCDEFGTDEYNHALGLKRAKGVKQLLVNSGIPAGKMEVVSYGESNPTCTGSTPACHAKNRRVEINKL